MSGAGFMFEMDGKRLVAGTVSRADNRLGPLGANAYVPTMDELSLIRNQLRPQTVTAGAPLMREILMGDVDQ